MSEHQKENIISLISLLTVSTVYIIYVFSRYSSSSINAQEELKYWAGAILLLIPIRIVLQIVLFILFKIIEGIFSNGKVLEEVKDERDRIVELKGNVISNNIFIIGFAASMVAVFFFNSSISAMFVIIFIAGYISEFIGIISKIYFYNKGI